MGLSFCVEYLLGKYVTTKEPVMNLELTPEQNAAYIAAALNAESHEEFIKVHQQFGQMDKAQQCIETLIESRQATLDAIHASMVARSRMAIEFASTK
jgi:hypothetical protein